MLEALDVFLYFSPQNLNDVYRLDLIYNINMLLQHKHVSTGNLDFQNCYYGLMNQQHRVFTGSMYLVGMHIKFPVNPDTQETSAQNIFLWLLNINIMHKILTVG